MTFSMNSLKAPGVDGIHSKLFQEYCNIVGDSVFHMVSEVFTQGSLDPKLNQTLLVLIPKCAGRKT